MHAADLEYVTPKERPLLLNTREPFVVRVESYHFVTVVTVQDRFLCDPKSEGPVPLTAEGLTGLLRDAVAVLMDREALARVKQEAASSGTDTISKDSGPDALAASEHGEQQPQEPIAPASTSMTRSSEQKKAAVPGDLDCNGRGKADQIEPKGFWAEHAVDLDFSKSALCVFWVEFTVFDLD